MGKLSPKKNKRITLQAKTPTKDAIGTPVSSWVDLATVWARAWTVSSAEGVVGAQMTMTRVQKFEIDFRSPLSSTVRVKFGNRYFSITGIDPDDRNRNLFLTCKEVVA